MSDKSDLVVVFVVHVVVQLLYNNGRSVTTLTFLILSIQERKNVQYIFQVGIYFFFDDSNHFQSKFNPKICKVSQ